MSNVQKLLWLSILIAICVVSGVTYKSYNTQPQQPIIEQCSIENPVWCDALIEEPRVEYNNLSKVQAELSKKADVYRAIQRLDVSPTNTGGSEKLN